MENRVFEWGDSRRYSSYSNYFKQHFGHRVQKVTINAGFSCPNRDGKLSVGGCTFCNNSAFNPSYCIPSKSVSQQKTNNLLQSKFCTVPIARYNEGREVSRELDENEVGMFIFQPLEYICTACLQVIPKHSHLTLLLL